MNRVARAAASLLLVVLPVVATTTSCTRAIAGSPLAVAGAGRSTASPPRSPSTSPTGRTPTPTSGGNSTIDLASLVGAWEGDYSCPQGKTGLRLVIGEVAGGALPTIFKFSPLPANPGAAAGSFSLIGKETGGEVLFRQDKWINQPVGYSMVDLEVSEPPRGNTLSGKVIGGRCTDFSVRKATGATPSTTR